MGDEVVRWMHCAREAISEAIRAGSVDDVERAEGLAYAGSLVEAALACYRVSRYAIDCEAIRRFSKLLGVEVANICMRAAGDLCDYYGVTSLPLNPQVED